MNRSFFTLIFLSLFGCFLLASSVGIYTFLSGSPPVLRQVQPVVSAVEKTPDQEQACRVFLGCLLANLGTESKPVQGYDPVFRMKTEYKDRMLTFDGITLADTLEGNCSRGIDKYCVSDLKNRTPSQMVLAAIKKFGKKGKLTTYTGIFIYPESCALWDTTRRDDKYEVTLAMK